MRIPQRPHNQYGSCPCLPSQLGNISISCSISSACHQADIPSYFHLPVPLPCPFHQSSAPSIVNFRSFQQQKCPNWNSQYLLSLWKDGGSRLNLSLPTFLRMAGAQSNPLALLFWAWRGLRVTLSPYLFKNGICSFVYFRLWASTCEYFWTGTERNSKPTSL